MLTATTSSVEETISFARTFGASLRRGDVVALSGDLGSGKTQFVKGACEAFRVREPVTSPTFVLLNRYSGRDKDGRELLLFHFDLYRVRSIAEVYDLGYEEFFRGDGVCFIEWADLFNDLGTMLPAERYHVKLSLGSEENIRRIEVADRGEPAVLAGARGVRRGIVP
ncbi:MAG: tRNA (adenosine(37)-N6)-threonylcarbamoyltransferase complex ATPase subunit type 1 TsaE [Bacteroidota bacterium]